MSRKIWIAGDQVTAVDLNGNFKFGGTGADGALSISSGTTTLSAGSAPYLEKNYTTVSITGTANVAFSSVNTTAGTSVVLRATGNVTITSSSSTVFDLRSMGGGLASGHANAGAVSTNSFPGQGGGGAGSTSGAGGDTAASASSSSILSPGALGGPNLPALSPFARQVLPGGNGGAGAAGTGASAGSGGAGGLGGGSLYIECAGAYNFTSGTINASGAVGSNGGAGTGSNGGGGGGGGGGGNIVVLYGSLTADSGTYTITGGSAGSGAGGGGAGGSGANGSTFRGVNNHFA